MEEVPDSKAAAPQRPFRHADHEREWTRAESLEEMLELLEWHFKKNDQWFLAHQTDDMNPQWMVDKVICANHLYPGDIFATVFLG